ncbi:MAG: penicillin-binding protein 2 [Candidatus Nomurabacteria bacterium]|jgi:cell division protein FtsI/penicillin-binding protein 2|nr:penicillin-binding protein 2 [Candidatus Nomurabacteria bacterium]
MFLGLQKGSRVRILAAFLFVAVAAIVVRLFQIQIIDHGKYVAMGESEYVKRLTIPARRGLVYTLDSGKPVPLVVNETIFTLFLDPKIIDEPKKIEDVIKKVAGGNITSDIKEALKKTDSRYQVVAKELTRKQAELIKKEKLAGIGFQEGTRRVYPEGGLAAQVLGFVNGEGAGQYGIEQALNERLKGKDGRLESVTDISSVPLTIGDKNINQPAEDGENVVLTIDRNIQRKTEQALKAELDRISPSATGSVMVMDPQSGKVLAMANFPSYNPAEYNKVKDAALFSNAVLTNSYEPGSVIKTFIMATGLDNGVVNPETTYYNRDYITVGDCGKDCTIGNAALGHTGNITMQTVLNYSLNTGAVTVAKLLGGGEVNKSARDRIYDYYHNRFGFGLKTGIELYEEQGIIVSPDDPSGANVRYANMTFGQGMNITMVQALSGFSAAINGGNYYKPTVVAGAMKDGKYKAAEAAEPVRTGVVKPATSDTLRSMLQTARGTTLAGQRDEPGYRIGGKTGTSETITTSGYTKASTVASYLGFGGGNTPKYAIMVRVQCDGLSLEGGIHAEPVFSEISNWLIKYMKVAKE